MGWDNTVVVCDNRLLTGAARKEKMARLLTGAARKEKMARSLTVGVRSEKKWTAQHTLPCWILKRGETGGSMFPSCGLFYCRDGGGGGE